MNKAERAMNFYLSDEFTKENDTKKLKEYARDLVNESKRRYSEELKGQFSPAKAYLKEKTNGKITIPKSTKTPKQYRDLIRTHANFLSQSTSTAEGYASYQEKVKNTLNSEGFDYGSLTEAQKKRFWKLYNTAANDERTQARWMHNPDLYDSEQRAKTIAEIIKKRGAGGKFRSYEEQWFELLSQVSPE